MPIAGLGGLDGELHLLAEARARNASVHTQLVHDLQTVGGGVFHSREPNILNI